MNKNKKYIKKRHRLCFKLARPIAWIIAKKYGLKYKKFPLKKGESYFILGNHQTALDPVFVCLSFDTPVYIVASDTLFNSSLPSKMLRYCFAPIKKRKGGADIECIRNCMKVAKEGGSVALFPEGNRAWADFQIYIDPAVCKLIRLLKLPVALYDFRGGYGVSPRWSAELRKGPFTGEVAEVLTTDMIDAMNDDELYRKILSVLRVIDSESGNLYKAKARAEYLERELFICPKCGGVSTLSSEGHFINCKRCGLSVEYRENLTLASADKEFKFSRLVEWYAFQLEKIKTFSIYKGKSDFVLYSDENVKIYDKTYNKNILLCKGRMTLDGVFLKVGAMRIALDDIEGASVVGGGKLLINTISDKSYKICGEKRLNVLKYILTFNVLKEKPLEDKYYGLEL